MFRIDKSGDFLVAQWLRLHGLNSRGPGSIPVQGTRSHIPQLTVCTLQPKILKAAAKTWGGKGINKY